MLKSEFKVGDKITFIGGKIYGSPDLVLAKDNKPESICVISSIKLNSKQPYLIKNKIQNWQGWVESSMIRK